MFFAHARFGAVEQAADIAAMFDDNQQANQATGNDQGHKFIPGLWI